MKLYTNKIELSREQLKTIINALNHEAIKLAEQLYDFLEQINEEDRTAEQTKFIEDKQQQIKQAEYTRTAFQVVLTRLKNNFINIDNVAIEYITDGNKRFND